MLLTLAVLVIVLNVLDSVTTEIGLHRLPTHLRGREVNPFMERLMKKSEILAKVFKQVLILGFVAYWVVIGEDFGLKLFVIILSLVVLNNSYTLIGRLLTKKKIEAPVRKLQRVLNLPDRFIYPVVILIFFGLAFLGAYLWK